MFADTDFILALIKDTDWLKENALNILNMHKDKIKTSITVMIEVALICKRLKMDTLKVFTNIFELIKVNEETYTICLRASLYIEKYGMNVFDSFHAAFCDDDKIISSDSVYEKLGIERIKLEKKANG